MIYTRLYQVSGRKSPVKVMIRAKSNRPEGYHVSVEQYAVKHALHKHGGKSRYTQSAKNLTTAKTLGSQMINEIYKRPKAITEWFK